MLLTSNGGTPKSSDDDSLEDMAYRRVGDVGLKSRGIFTKCLGCTKDVYHKPKLRDD